MSTLIRPLAEADLEQVIALEKISHHFPWSCKAHQDGIASQYPSLVIANGKIILGFIIFNYYADECHLLDMCIASNQQRKGYAQQLVEAMFESAINNTMSRIILEVRSSNLAAQQLYKKMGFCKIGLRKNYYPGNPASPSLSFEDAIVMEKLFD